LGSIEENTTGYASASADAALAGHAPIRRAARCGQAVCTDRQVERDWPAVVGRDDIEHLRRTLIRLLDAGQ
jgi:hypothetical protein